MTGATESTALDSFGAPMPMFPQAMIDENNAAIAAGVKPPKWWVCGECSTWTSSTHHATNAAGVGEWRCPNAETQP